MSKLNKTSQKLKELLEKENVSLGYEMIFPQYNILPDEVKLAIAVLAKNGMVIRFVIKPKPTNSSPPLS